jgi:phage-related baseplate assembly protein
MSGLNTIDLSRLPAPNVVEKLDFEQILAAMKADLISRDNSLADALQLESEPLVKLLEVCAYRELLLRQRINDASRAVMLATATGNDLDHLAALFGVERQLIDAGDTKAQPPIPPTFEKDERLRYRVPLALRSVSTAGALASYRYHALDASAQVKDVAISSPAPGQVVITILSNDNHGVPDDALLAAVIERLNDKTVRPLTDQVFVQSAKIINYKVIAKLSVNPGPDAEVVRQTAEQQLREYVTARYRLGCDITLSGLYASLHPAGIERVYLEQPTNDQTIADNTAAYCEHMQIDIRHG